MIPLPMTAPIFLHEVLAPALRLLPEEMTSDEAKVMVVAICLQESGLACRKQIGGPAHGLAQFEQSGGVRGVLGHHATRATARALCGKRHVIPTASAVYEALLHDDVLAAGFARLLLWTDPHALPALGDEAGAWGLYLRTWRPGKPRPAHFSGNYQQALLAVRGDSIEVPSCNVGE